MSGMLTRVADAAATGGYLFGYDFFVMRYISGPRGCALAEM